MATTMASTQLDALVTLRAKLARRYWASAFDSFSNALLQGGPRAVKASITAGF